MADEGWQMSQVGETEIWVEGLQITQINLEADNILPFRAFSGVYPDEAKLSEGYWGNVRSIDSRSSTHESHIRIGRRSSRV